jgi:hypothetical protein
MPVPDTANRQKNTQSVAKAFHVGVQFPVSSLFYINVNRIFTCSTLFAKEEP